MTSSVPARKLCSPTATRSGSGKVPPKPDAPTRPLNFWGQSPGAWQRRHAAAGCSTINSLACQFRLDGDAQKDMRRFGELRSSLPVARVARWPVSRFYSTKNEKLDGHSLTERTETDTPRREEPNGSDYGFDDWSEINRDENTIDTAAGSLPISPLLDSSWRQARQRDTTKQLPNPAKYNRFRRRMEENPYGEHCVFEATSR